MFQTFESQSERGAATERIKELRRLMAAARLDAYLVPRADEHQGEYVPASAARLKWLTGFSGSAGLAIVDQEARDPLRRRPLHGAGARRGRAGADRGFRRWRAPASASGSPSTCRRGQTVGFDPRLHTVAEIERLEAALKPHEHQAAARSRAISSTASGAARVPPRPRIPSRCTRRSSPAARRRTRSPTSRSG